MLRYKIDVLAALKKAGYSSYRICKEKPFSEGTMQKLRKQDIHITLESLNAICNLLRCQPGDLIEWIPKEK